MTTERGLIHMPIATAITIILIMVYILLRAVSRTGELLLKTLVRVGGLRKITTPTMFLGARQRGMTRWSRRVSAGNGRL
jgi:hypothetical protein